MTYLVLFSHKHFYHTPRGMETTGALTRQVDALATHFKEVTLCVPISDNPGFIGIGVTAPNISFHPLPIYKGYLDFVRKIPTYRLDILKMVKSADLGLAIIPGQLGILASIVAQKQNFPLFHWVVGDWSENVLARRTNTSAQWVISNFVSPILDKLMIYLTKDVLSFYNGRILYNTNSPLSHTRFSSSICLEDINTHIRPVPRPPYRLLFVGRLAGEKGIIHLLRAAALLITKGHAVIVNIVGRGHQESKLRTIARELNIDDSVTFHGFIPQGEALRNLYRQADIFVLPSLTDQQPKVLTEAMAQGLPVIATEVGGVPSIVRHERTGLLVPPGDPQSIANAVKRIIEADVLRNRLITEGLKHARNHTVEIETTRMMNIIIRHFGLNKNEYGQ